MPAHFHAVCCEFSPASPALSIQRIEKTGAAWQYRRPETIVPGSQPAEQPEDDGKSAGIADSTAINRGAALIALRFAPMMPQR